MIEFEFVLRWLHVLGATVLIGTGAGIAFFMVMAHRTRDAVLIAHTASVVVVADVAFTALAVVLQPITGIALALNMGWRLSEGWLLVSIGLYVVVGAFWLPVIWLQIQMRDLAREAVKWARPLPPRYTTLYRLWFVCGIPAFTAILVLLWLMIARPELW